VSLNIPAATKPVRIVLEGTPLLKGMLVLTGCRWAWRHGSGGGGGGCRGGAGGWGGGIGSRGRGCIL
jgi:uncharacterized membrane protein YgcG